MQEVRERRLPRRTELPALRSHGRSRPPAHPDPWPSHGREVADAARRYLGLLHRVAHRILGDEELAKDAVQEALVSLWLAPEVPDPMRGWLVRTVVHRSLHARRAHHRRRHWEGEAGRLATERCPLCDPERQLDARRRLRSLETALESLSEELRRVLLLHEVEGLEYREIARRLAVPVGTVRSRLNRARRQIRARSAEPAATDGPIAEGAA